MSVFAKDKLYSRNCELPDSKVVQIFQSEIGDVGCVVWDAAIVLAKFYEHILSSNDCLQSENRTHSCSWVVAQNSKETEIQADSHGCVPNSSQCEKAYICIQCCLCRVVEIHRKKGIVYELGSGTGYVGIIVGALGGNVVITDLPEFVELMQYNIEANKGVLDESSGQVKAESLTWGKVTTVKADLILLADCIYYEQSLEPLVQSIKDLSKPDTVIVCCHEERTTDNKPRLQRLFFSEMGKYFSCVKVPMTMQHPDFSCEEIHIHLFTPLPK